MSLGKLVRGRAGIAALFCLVALPLLLRMGPVAHGFPDQHLPDTHIVRGALGMAQEKSLAPPTGKYSTYPNLLPYMLLPIYAGQYAVGRATGAWGGAGEFANAARIEPWIVHLPARLLVALLGAVTPWLVFRAARNAGLGRGAWVAAWLVATSLLHVHFSVQERPWVPLCTFTALALVSATSYARDGRRRDLVLCAFGGALAYATHQAGLAVLGLAGLAWACGPHGWRGPALRRRFVEGLLAVVVFALAGTAIGYPQSILPGDGAPDVIAGEPDLEDDGAPGFAIGGQAIRLAVRPESLTRLSYAFVGHEPVLALLGLAGLVFAIRRRAARPGALFALVWGAFFLTNQNDHVRYLLPLVVLLAVPAGYAGEALLGRRDAPSRGGLVLVALLLAVPLVLALRLGHLLRTDDTRVEARGRLELERGTGLVAVDRYGPDLPLDLASLERVATLRELYGREAFRHALLAEGHGELVGPGFDAIRVEDLFSFDDRSGTVSVRESAEGLGATPSEVFRALGVRSLALVRRRPRQPHPLDPLIAGAEPIFVISPAAGDGAASEAYLPTEMEFALTALWSVDRPGPRVELYRLDPR